MNLSTISSKNQDKWKWLFLQSEVAEEALEVDEGLTVELERELRIKDEDDKDASGDDQEEEEEDVAADEVAEKWSVTDGRRDQKGFKTKEDLVVGQGTGSVLNPFRFL